MRSIRTRIERAALSALLAAAVGCSDRLAAPIAAGGSETPRRGGTLRLSSFGDIRGLDPAVTADLLAASAIELIFAGLVDFDEKGNVTPDLAERFEVADEGTTYRFFLREGVHFHTGEELTADDVRRSMERALHPSTPNPLASFYETIEGFDDYTKGRTAHLSGVVVEGRYVVSVRLRERDARFLPAFALHNLRPVCPNAGERYVDTWLPCGAGPFRLAPGGWDHGRSLTLLRNEAYYVPGLPYLDSVVWTYLVNVLSERFKFEDGELDILRDLSQADSLRFQNDPRWKPFGEYEPERGTTGESMNTELPPFDNVEVRRAVAAAIDRSQYQALRPANVRPATQVLPPAMPGYDPTFAGQAYDPAAALEHMKRAGYAFDPATGTGGYPGVVTYLAHQSGFNEASGQILQQALARIGLRMEIKLASYPTFLALSYRRKRTQISAPGWSQDYPDPADFFEPLFGSEAINDDNSTNTSFYSNPRLDELLVRGRHELDPARRFALYGEANRIVCDEAPWAFTHYVRYSLVHQPYVHDFRPHPVWSDYVARTWLDRGPAGAQRAAGDALLPGYAALVHPWKPRRAP